MPPNPPGDDDRVNGDGRDAVDDPAAMVVVLLPKLVHEGFIPDEASQELVEVIHHSESSASR